MSDFLANPSTVDSAYAALDWELGAKLWGPRLMEPVQAVEVPIETLDEMTRRILRPIWNTDTPGWKIADGNYTVYVGASSRDIRLTGTFHVGGG